MTLSKTRGAVALMLSSFVMFGAVSLTSATPQKKTPKKTAKAAPAGKGDPAAGKKVYDAQGCGACHVIGDKGGKTGPELTHIAKTWSGDKMAKQMRNPKAFKADAKMPAYPPDKISDKEMKNLIAYLVTLK